MIKGMKIRLLPTKEQEELMLKSVSASRFAYNWGLSKWNEVYKQTGKNPSYLEIKKEFNSMKKQEEYSWLYKVSAQVTSQAFIDLNNAFKNFLKKNAKYPKFKSKKKSRDSFYVRYDKLYFKDDVVNIEKIGKVKYSTNYDIPNTKYINPRCSFDGKYWYLSFGIEVSENQVDLNENLVVGIDLGLKDLAIVNVLDRPIKNINKTRKVKKLEKKLKRLQRKVSKKYQANKKENEFIKTNNIIKLEKKIRLIYRKLSNIRNNHTHQSTSKIIKLRPKKVVMEDLNISGLMKNKHLSKAIRNQCFYEFTRQMEYKCKFNNIEFIKADRFYPSSKICSSCGNIKSDLRLKDRIYKCDDCGLIIDRDKNASINLANYKLA